MAKSTIVSSVLLLVCAMVLKPALATAVNSEQPLTNAEPPPGYDASIEGCRKKMPKLCGQELFKNIFLDGPDVSKSCCSVLVAMGDPCHSEFVDIILSSDKYSARAAEYLKRSVNTWKHCKSVAGGN